LGNYLPHATLTFSTLSLGTTFYPNDLFKQTNLTFGISFPIWNNGQRELALSRARVNKDVARARRQDMDRAVQHDVTAAYDAYLTARATAELAAQGLAVARESFRVQRTRYSSGATTILDLLDAEVDLSQAEADLVQARYGTRLALAGLEAILGRRLFTDKDTTP
jgi:outer membrane protein TolC